MTVGQTEYVQPIALLRAGTHEDAVRAVTLASVTAYIHTGDDPAWKPWIARRFAKSVRRAKAGPFTAVESGAAAKTVVGDAQALAFLPTTYDAMDPALRKFQVAGTELPREGWGSPAHVTDLCPLVLINESVVTESGEAMSTGKTAAQAAHGLFSWFLRLDEESRTAWFEGGQAFSLLGLSDPEFTNLSSSARVIIRDAGYTEIPQNSVTVAVI